MFIQAFRVFPDEGAILGRLLTGYTDIEYQLCFCAGMGGGDVAKAITDRPRTIAPWWLWPAEVATVVLRGPVERATQVWWRRRAKHSD